MLISDTNVTKILNIAEDLWDCRLPIMAMRLEAIANSRNDVACLFEALEQLRDKELLNVAAFVQREREHRAAEAALKTEIG